MKPAHNQAHNTAVKEPPHDPKTGEIIEPTKGSAAPGQTAPVAQPSAGQGQVVAYNYADDAGLGFEGASKADFIVPILDILQSGSPEIANSTIEGARPGMFIIRALAEVFDGKDTGLPLIGCGRDHVFNEWNPREKGGGLVKTYSPDDELVKRLKAQTPFGKIKMPNTGNDLVETFYLYALIPLPDRGAIRMSIPFWSTKINTYRGFMTKANGIMVPGANGQKIPLPMFAHQFRLKTRFIEKKTFKWHGYTDINFDGADMLSARIDPTGPVYAEARAFAVQVKQGLVKADMASAAPHDDAEAGASGGGSSGGGNTGGGADGKEQIPF